MRTAPTYEETIELLRAPFRRARVTKPIYAFNFQLEPGDVVSAKPYHNDPDGYVSIRHRGPDGEPHEWTEYDDRIEYLEAQA